MEEKDVKEKSIPSVELISFCCKGNEPTGLWNKWNENITLKNVNC